MCRGLMLAWLWEKNQGKRRGSMRNWLVNGWKSVGARVRWLKGDGWCDRGSVGTRAQERAGWMNKVRMIPDEIGYL